MHKRYIPSEVNSTLKCIWCKEENAFNKAHIISEFLISKNTQDNYLKKSVCIKCNTFFAKIEDWLSKYSPVLILKGGNTFSKRANQIKNVPIFFYLDEFKEWVVVHIIEDLHFLPQIILTEAETLMFIAAEDELSKVSIITEKIKTKNYIIDIKKDLPFDCNPRAIEIDGKIILIGRNRESISMLQESVCKESSSWKTPYTQKKAINPQKIVSEKEFIMYLKWSPTVWALYNAKISFEFLALTNGSDFALDNHFDLFRKWVLSHKLNEIDDISSIVMNNNARLPFELESYSYNITQETFKIKLNKDERKPYYISGCLQNDQKNLYLYTTIAWLPAVEIILSDNFLPYPIFNVAFYQFKESTIEFLKLSNVEEKNYLFLIQSWQEGLKEFYKDYLITILEK